MKRYSLLLISAAAIAMPVNLLANNVAQANDRYKAPPPMVLSPDLSSPWLLQLKNKSGQQNSVQKRRTSAWGQQRQKPRTTVRSQTRPRQATGIFALFNKPKQTATRQVPQQRTVSQKKRQTGSSVAYRPAPVTSASASAITSQAYIAQQAAQRPIDPKFLPQNVSYQTSQKPGTIIIDTNTRYLYLVEGNGQARRYGVGVGKQGFEWKGTEKITRKAEWPSWRPPAEMIARERKKGRELPTFMPGGPENPMGARALYLGSTLYRIHGTNQPWTIGHAVSSGCIRMRNEDVMDLYERVRNGAKVIVS